MKTTVEARREEWRRLWREEGVLPAITVRQPWASLLARGIKTIETRTHDRFKVLDGLRIAIHAGKRWDAAFFDVLEGDLGDRLSAVRVASFHVGPKATVLATARVAEARRLTSADTNGALCAAGGLFGLVLADVVRLPAPVPARGAQGVWKWTVPESLVGELDL